jgi:hypothetical protein
MRRFAPVFPQVAVDRDSCAHQLFPALIQGAAQRDGLVLRADLGSPFKQLACNVESGPCFRVLSF